MGDVKEKLPQLDIETRHKMLIYTDDEVVDNIGNALGHLENSIQVIFEDQECLDCGEVGDSRLLSSYCHMESMLSHPLTLKHHHPQEEPVPYHPIKRLEGFHPGAL